MYPHLPTLIRALALTFTPSRFSVRRAVLGVLVLCAAAALVTFNWVFDLVDLLFFPRAGRTPVEAPVFIIAAPRSGTTFLHNLLSLDEERFTYLRLYDTVFQAVSLRRTLDALGHLDRLLGQPVVKLSRLVQRRIFKGWDGIHSPGLEQSEEDESLWVLSFLSPAIWMLFPYPNELSELGFVDRMAEPVRRYATRLIRWQMGRHMAYGGRGRTLLLKNVLLAGRLDVVTRAFPGARFIYLVRDPIKTVPSSVSMFTTPWKAHSPELPMNSPEYRMWADLVMDYYDVYERLITSLPPERCVVLPYDALVGNPRAAVAQIYERFGFTMSPAFAQVLERETQRAASYTSRHAYTLADYGLDATDVYQRLQHVFERHGLVPPEAQTPPPTTGTPVVNAAGFERIR